MKKKKIVKTLIYCIMLVFIFCLCINNASTAYVSSCYMSRYNQGFGAMYRLRSGVIEDPIYDYSIDNDYDYYCLRGHTPLGYTDYMSNKISLFDSNLSQNSISDYIFRTDNGLTKEQSIKAMQWLVKNMYYESSTSNNTEGKKQLMKNNLVTIMEQFGASGGNNSVNKLDDEFIGVLQQFVVWKFVNHSSYSEYYANAITDVGSVKKFTKTSNDVEDWFANTDPQIAEQGYQLFTALVNGATKYAKGETTYTLEDYNKNNVSIEQNENSRVTVMNGGTTFKVGPMKIKVNKDSIDTINDELTIRAPGFSGGFSNKKYFIGSEEKTSLKECVDKKDFYLQFDVGSNLTLQSVSINYKVKVQFKTMLTSYVGNIYSTSGKQPLLEVGKDLKKDDKSTYTTFCKKSEDLKEIDLALTKQIVNVNRNGNNVYQNDLNRLINISKDEIISKKTAAYMMNKKPVDVQIGDIVTYKITVYNEGKNDGYVKEITDFLPNSLEYVGYDETHSDIPSNNVSINSSDSSKIVIAINSQDEGKDGKKINRYDEENEILSSFCIAIKCKVKDNAKAGKKITNVAEITDYGSYTGSVYYDSNDVDMDSEQENAFTIDEYNKAIEYTDVEDITHFDKGIIQDENNNYIQDDEDYEQIVINKFDLALRKFITSVNNQTVATSREPTLDNFSTLNLDRNGTLIYYHTKSPVYVQTGSRVIYTIRVYNEGNINGKVGQITDYLPTGLELVPQGQSEINRKYGWTVENNIGGVTKVVSNYEANINAIGFNGIQEAVVGYSKKFTADWKIECQVTSKTKNEILTNVSEITNYGYYDDTNTYKEASVAGIDRDSIEGNVFAVNNNIKNPGQYYSNQNVDSTKNEYYGLEDDDDFENVKILNNSFDLALRKFITKINGTEISNSRVPMIVQKSADRLTNSGTAGYYHEKDPLEVKTGDIITYTLRVYNEGYAVGYVRQITDYLPEGLELVPDEMWQRNDDESRNGITAISTTSSLGELEIPASFGSYGYQKLAEGTLQEDEFFWKDVEIKCKVTSTTKDKILINIAEITDYGYKNGNIFNSAVSSNVDRDSSMDNVFNNQNEDALIDDYYSERNINDPYKSEIIGNVQTKVVPGRQDDDDFESVKVTATKKDYKLKIKKTDDSENNLSGVTFQFGYYTNNAIQSTDTRSTNGNGEIDYTQTINVDEEKTMLITEKTAKIGYKNILKDIYVKVTYKINSSGELEIIKYNNRNFSLVYKYNPERLVQSSDTVNYNSYFGDVYVSLDNETTPPQLNVRVRNMRVPSKYSLKIKKVDSTTEEALEGVKFTVQRQPSSSYTAVTTNLTNEDGIVTVYENIDIIDANNDAYTITEIDLGTNKYIKLKNPLSITIKKAIENNLYNISEVTIDTSVGSKDVELEDGTFVTVEAEIISEDSGNIVQITIPNKPIAGKYDFKIKKTVDGINQAISGVKFKINNQSELRTNR